MFPNATEWELTIRREIYGKSARANTRYTIVTEKPFQTGNIQTIGMEPNFVGILH